MNNQTETQNCDFTSDLKLKGFKVYQINGDQSKIPVYSRRDFYKICINTSKSIIQYADRGIETDGTILFFGNPIIPYSWETVSEGIAYGMLLSSYMADKALFDGLWLYYKDNVNGNKVMNWKISGCSATIGYNGATDAELDTAFALIVADYQWASAGTINYKNDATALISAVKNYEIEANTYVLKPGDQFGGSQITNPSYFSPAYYRVFGTFTNDTAFWNQVAAKSYTVINNNLTKNNAVGGLVSDWCEASGAYSSQAGGYNNAGKTYTYDAARTPWRIAVDYLWYGTPEAKIYSKKSSDFVGGRISR